MLARSTLGELVDWPAIGVGRPSRGLSLRCITTCMGVDACQPSNDPTAFAVSAETWASWTSCSEYEHTRCAGACLRRCGGVADPALRGLRLCLPFLRHCPHPRPSPPPPSPLSPPVAVLDPKCARWESDAAGIHMMRRQWGGRPAHAAARRTCEPARAAPAHCRGPLASTRPPHLSS